jgi:hypothetical protein
MSMLFAVFFRGGWQKICYLLYVKEVFVGKKAKKLGVLALFALCVALSGCSKQTERERLEKEIAAARDSLSFYTIEFEKGLEPYFYFDENYGGKKVIAVSDLKKAREINKSVRDRRIYFQSLLDSLHKSLPFE